MGTGSSSHSDSPLSSVSLSTGKPRNSKIRDPFENGEFNRSLFFQRTHHSCNFRYGRSLARYFHRTPALLCALFKIWSYSVYSFDWWSFFDSNFVVSNRKNVQWKSMGAYLLIHIAKWFAQILLWISSCMYHVLHKCMTCYLETV